MVFENDDNGWQLEDDTEVREQIISDDRIAAILSMPPALPPTGASPRKRWRALALKIGLSLFVITAAFLLGVLFSENTQLKDTSQQLETERATLSREMDVIGGAVDQCQDALNLCAQDVDLLQELSEYALTPKAKYGDGYFAVETLQKKAEALTAEKTTLQTDIEDTVKNIWKPAKKSKAFWRELRQKLAKKRQIDRKIHRLERKQAKALADLDKTFYEKKLAIKEVIAKKNAARREVAKRLENLGSTGAHTPVPANTPDNAADDIVPKQDLAAVID